MKKYLKSNNSYQGLYHKCTKNKTYSNGMNRGKGSAHKMCNCKHKGRVI